MRWPLPFRTLMKLFMKNIMKEIQLKIIMRIYQEYINTEIRLA